jgi:hypothetical protein
MIALPYGIKIIAVFTGETMRQRFFTGTLGAKMAFAACLTLPARATSIVVDGGFETPSVSPYSGSIDGFWVVTSGDIDIENTGFSGSTRSAHSGNQFAYLDDSDSVNTLTQTLATTAGQSYLISYYVADTAPDSLTVSFGGQTLFSGTAPTGGISSPSDYVNYTYTETATSSSTVLSFVGQWNMILSGNGTQLDDVSVTAVPEPAAFGFTALGCIGLLALRSRTS